MNRLLKGQIKFFRKSQFSRVNQQVYFELHDKILPQVALALSRENIDSQA